MNPARGAAAADRMARVALASLASVTLAWSVPSWGNEAPAAVAEPTAVVEPAAAAPDVTAEQPAADSAAARAVRHRPAAHLTAAQAIEVSVSRLARGLDLDSAQQETLRQILVDQHRRIMKLRGANAAAMDDVTGTTRAIYEQSKARIRAMLNDEQKKKYSADVPHGDLAPAQADLKHWMDMQETKRRQDQAEGDAK